MQKLHCARLQFIAQRKPEQAVPHRLVIKPLTLFIAAIKDKGILSFIDIVPFSVTTQFDVISTIVGLISAKNS
jgi:hypothetical protein